MKNIRIKNQIVFLIIIFALGKNYAQDVMNPYRYLNQSHSQLTVPIATGTTQSYSWVKNDQTRIIVGSFDGEYEIELPDYRNFWNSLRIVPPTLYISYEMEIKSFPFTPDCYLDPTGCGGNSTMNRRLVLPSEPYNQQLDSWGLLNRIKPMTSLEDGQSQTLVSIQYKDNLPLSAPISGIRYYLPHSVINFKINLHCEPFSISAPTTPPFYTINWTFDNTRGRMRYYPFCPCNCSSCQSHGLYDITFSPQFLYKSQGHKYNEPNSNFFNTQTQMLEYEVTIPSGTINYYDFQELSAISPCANPKATIPLANDYFYNGSNFDHIYLPQYSVISALPLQSIGINPAGYNFNPITNLYEVIPSIRHDYEINYDFDIEQNEISQSDGIFYNPSDVTITATDLHFPSNYSFRTIRGVYPSPAEVAADNTAINGGAFNDLRLVPVRTDLRCEDAANFPHDASTPDDSKYASLYRLAAGSKLTLDPCVRVFDAAFILNLGSTLELSNKTSIIGLHRVAIDRNGGRLIEKYELNSGTLYLQDKIETANAPNSYYVNSKIVAGENVEPSSPIGPYIASSGSDLELIARDYIKLDHGFHAENGSEVKIQIDPTLQIPACPQPISGGSGNRFAQSSSKDDVEVTTNHIKLMPTLFTNSTGIYSENKNEDPIVSVEVLDASGKKIKQINEINDYFIEIDLSSVNEGMYFFIIQTKNNRKVLKGVKQN